MSRVIAGHRAVAEALRRLGEEWETVRAEAAALLRSGAGEG